MKRMSPKERLIANEVIFRDVNSSIQKFVQAESGPLKTIPFYCECSDPDCLERINLTPQQYQKLHETKKHFVLKNGHEFTQVEKIVTKKDGFEVVKKHFQPPKAKDIDFALKQIDTEGAL